MECSDLPEFLEGNLSVEVRAQFERHLVVCAACQNEVEAIMQMWALGAELSRSSDRPRAVLYAPDVAPPITPRRRQRWLLAATALAAAAVFAIVLFTFVHPEQTPESQIMAHRAPQRAMVERVPYAPLDGYRQYDTLRAGPTRTSEPPAATSLRPGGAPSGEPISIEVLAELEKRRDQSALIAALIARGDILTAKSLLQQAGPGDHFDVERAVIAERQGQTPAALALLDHVLSRAPRHAQALWNRAVALENLDLPLAAAEAFDSSAALGEPGWSAEAAARRDTLRHRENERIDQMRDVLRACKAIRDGTMPPPEFVRRHAALCRPSLYVAVRQAMTRDEVLRLLTIARALDEASGNTASADMVHHIATLDFKVRAPYAALYRRLRSDPKPGIPEQTRIVAQLRVSGQNDLLLGALLRVDLPPSGHSGELVRLARASGDPYLEELALEQDAKAKLASGKAIEAEASLRDAVRQCAAHDVELGCTSLQATLIELHLARHRPTEARATALSALARSKRVGLHWDERVMFGYLGKAAQLERNYSQMRAYFREAALRVDECWQTRLDQEAISAAELAELRFDSARAELDRAPLCGDPPSIMRVQTAAELARFEAGPARTAELRRDLERVRRETELSPGERAHIDALEGRALSETDPEAARVALNRAIAAADALAVHDVEATKARNLAYRTLLVLGAKDLGAAALLDLFAAASRAQLRSHCALGAIIDGERLLLVARDARGRTQQVFESHAFKTPDFDAPMLVPPALVASLSGCSRVDVFALAPLYGQPQLLPAELAWSYRGPAGSPRHEDARRPTILTIEDAQPPAVLELPRLQSPLHAPRNVPSDEVILRSAEATPGRVREEIARADFAEIHAHGFVDLGISDVSLIALSPDADGTFALTARVIAGLKLPRAPFIALASCDAAYTAPYLHEPWSLPYAFLLAGARAVLAPATTIPDRDADSFFQAVGEQILRGIDPAIVLRDLRMLRHAGPTSWVDSVVLFD